jgi:hypothetical protein
VKLNQLAFFFICYIFLNANAKILNWESFRCRTSRKSHPKDPAAVAAIYSKVRFEYVEDKGFEIITVVQTRIKIYKKEGYDWANQAVRYFSK